MAAMAFGLQSRIPSCLMRSTFRQLSTLSYLLSPNCNSTHLSSLICPRHQHLSNSFAPLRWITSSTGKPIESERKRTRTPYPTADDNTKVRNELERKIQFFEDGSLQEGRYDGNPWSKREDDVLQKAVTEHKNDWTRISSVVGNGRTNRGCRIRWELSLQGNINRKPFTLAEIDLILKLSHLHPKQWQKIAREVGNGRTHRQISELVKNRLDTSRSLGLWTVQEDELLRRAVAVHGVGKWTAIAEIMPGRNDAQCYGRWSLILAPGLKRGKWSKEENVKLKQIVMRLKQSKKPFHFGHVSAFMDNTRHRKSCRERYERLVRRGQADPL